MIHPAARPTEGLPSAPEIARETANESAHTEILPIKRWAPAGLAAGNEITRAEDRRPGPEIARGTARRQARAEILPIWRRALPGLAASNQIPRTEIADPARTLLAGRQEGGRARRSCQSDRGRLRASGGRRDHPCRRSPVWLGNCLRGSEEAGRGSDQARFPAASPGEARMITGGFERHGWLTGSAALIGAPKAPSALAPNPAVIMQGSPGWPGKPA
jgi:hypothetical protein